MRDAVAHQYLRRGKNSQQVEVIDFEFVSHKYNQLNGAVLDLPQTHVCSGLATAAARWPYESMQEFIDTRNVSSGG